MTATSLSDHTLGSINGPLLAAICRIRLAVPSTGGPSVPDFDWSWATNSLTYNGHSARVELDAEDRIFVGRIASLRDIVDFRGASLDELEAALCGACRRMSMPAPAWQRNSRA